MVTRTVDDGGESERLAPVTPLFGRSATSVPIGERPSDERAGEEKASASPALPESIAEQAVDGTRWTDTWAEPSGEGSGERGPSRSRAHSVSFIADSTHSAERDTRDAAEDDAGVGPDPVEQGEQAEQREHAERVLVRKLRTRSLSVVESRRVLVEAGLPREEIDDVLEDFGRRGYLDDAALADQLVHAGTDRKGQGRQAISLALSKRGIPRDIADAAISGLPDDDAERALDFARSKAKSLDRVDDDAAFRRLVGALSRRGYGGSVATGAARSALAERRNERNGGSPSGVRFR